MSAHWLTICTFLAQIVDLGFLCKKFRSFLQPICYLSVPLLALSGGCPHYPQDVEMPTRLTMPVTLPQKWVV
jgi:hypothetical protein